MLKWEGRMALPVPWEKCLWTTLHLEICTSTVNVLVQLTGLDWQLWHATNHLNN